MVDQQKLRRDSLVEALMMVLTNRAAYIKRLRSMNIITLEEANDLLGYIRRVKSAIDICTQAYDETTPPEEGT